MYKQMKSIVKLLIMLWVFGAASINQPEAVFRSRLQLLLIEPFSARERAGTFRRCRLLTLVSGCAKRYMPRANRGRMMNSLYSSQVYKAPPLLFAL
jgi:hypothetical protein